LSAEVDATVQSLNAFSAQFDATGAQLIVLEIDSVDIAAEPDGSRKVVNVDSVKTYVESQDILSAADAQTKYGLKRFEFTEASLVWHVMHSMSSTIFDATPKNSDGTPMSARIEVVDANSFKVHLTAAMTGMVDVRF